MNLEDVRGRLTITVPEAGELLGIGRDAAYDAVERGDIPSLRIGRRILVPVPKLLELVGVPYYARSTPSLFEDLHDEPPEIL